MNATAAIATARAAVEAARASPQSRKKAMLAALLIDAAVDALFEMCGESDVLAFRADVCARAPQLRPVLDLAAIDGTSLVLEPVEVDIRDYPALGVEDFMVSLYNGRTVPRVLIATPDARRIDVHEALSAALAALEAELR